MSTLPRYLRRPAAAMSSFALALVLLNATPAQANGAIGEHVNDMSGHIDQYTTDVNWLIGQVDGIVDAYEKGGLQAARPEALVDYWEAVDVHAAIEINYIPLYASIWQGLFGVRMAIEEEKPLPAVREEQVKLEQTLWQALGAVKLAADFQKRGMLPPVDNTEASSPVETVDIIKRELDRVVAKYAEKLPDEAIEIVQGTYLDRFEGIEGALIEQDAKLVEELELDFNAVLQKAIQSGKSVDEVRGIVVGMQGKLDRCRALLEEAAANRSDVF